MLRKRAHSSSAICEGTNRTPIKFRDQNLADIQLISRSGSEHGGFYDHVQPPANAPPLLGQNSGKLGPRVPAFVVPAYTPARSVLKDTFDHATIAATILRRFWFAASAGHESAGFVGGGSAWALSLPNP